MVQNRLRLSPENTEAKTPQDRFYVSHTTKLIMIQKKMRLCLDLSGVCARNCMMHALLAGFVRYGYRFVVVCLTLQNSHTSDASGIHLLQPTHAFMYLLSISGVLLLQSSTSTAEIIRTNPTPSIANAIQLVQPENNVMCP